MCLHACIVMTSGAARRLAPPRTPRRLRRQTTVAILDWLQKK